MNKPRINLYTLMQPFDRGIWDIYWAADGTSAAFHLVHEDVDVCVRTLDVRGTQIYALAILEGGRASRVPGFVSADFAEFHARAVQLIAQATPLTLGE